MFIYLNNLLDKIKNKYYDKISPHRGYKNMENILKESTDKDEQYWINFLERKKKYMEKKDKEAIENSDEGKMKKKENLHTQTKNVVNRISRAAGHLNSIKKMVEEGRDCSEVLIQLSAVRAAINSIGKIVLKDHMEHCIVQAVKDGDNEAIDNFEKSIEKFLK